MAFLNRVALGALLLVFAAQAASAKPQELTIAAAASLQGALEEVGLAIAKDQPDIILQYNFAATSTLVRQIEAGAPLDVVFSADEANMDNLAKAGLIVDSTRTDVLRNELVLIVKAALAADVVRTPADLGKDAIKHVALCDEAVPIGHYGKDLLTKLDLWKKLEPKLVRPDNARATLAMVVHEAAEAGFVYTTDVGKDAAVRVVYRAGDKDGVDIRYPAAAVKSTKHAAAAAQYVKLLQSAAARQIFEKFGFTLLAKP